MRGHQVTMVCGSYRGAVTGLTQPFVRGKRRGMVEGIDVIEMDCAYANAMGFIRRAMVFLKFALASTKVALTEPVDVVFATTTPLTAGIPGMAARWLRGKRFVFEVRDLWPELPKAMGVITNPLWLWGMGLLEWASYRSAHRLIGLAPGIVEGITRRGVPENQVVMIPNGCDVERFSESVDPWRPEGLADDMLLAVYAGTHGIANGLDAVLDAAALLKNQGRDDIRIVLIGDGKLKPNLVARAARESLSNVIFHDPVSKGKLCGLMKSADVGLQILDNVPAFYYGTSPNKFFDCLAAGLPVLTNYPGWIADLITTHQAGFAVPPGNAAVFAQALIAAADDRVALKRMGASAQHLADTMFNRAQLSQQFAEWLEAVNG
jgi:glycosyltransferase involved in cell wall biosynthesis